MIRAKESPASMFRRGNFIRAMVLVVPAALGVSLQWTPARAQPDNATSRPTVLAPGTVEMVERLQRLRAETDPRTNIYLNARRVALLKEGIGRANSKRQELLWRFTLAKELLRAGESQAAVDELESLERWWTDSGRPMGPQDRQRFRDQMAISMLRIAEQENCCAQHNTDSCFVPIQGGGIHNHERGSRGAIRYLTDTLIENPDDLAARWLLNLAYMTLGEYPEHVPDQWLIPEQVFESGYDLERFYDVSGTLGLDVVSLAGGSIMEDFDRDGLLDIMASSWGLSDQLRYFRNNGDGTFTDRTPEAGLLGIVGGLNMSHADYNNDGYPDVLVLRGAWWGEAGRHPNSLLKNNGDGSFEDVTAAAGVLSLHPTQTAAWGDYNNDGWIDLFIGNESSPKWPHPCELFHNNGDGTFTERAAELGIAHEGFVKGVAFGDYNNDGLPDLYLSVHRGPNILFRNDGPKQVGARAGRGDATPWSFTDVTATAGVSKPGGSFPTWFWDFNNDGWLDILVFGYAWSSVGDFVADLLGRPHRGERPWLYRNNGDGTFTDIAKTAGLDRFVLAMGANFGDLDNDGFLDFYAATGEPDYRAVIPNLMFRNAGDESFQDVTTSGGFGNIQKGHGVAFGDIDNDGDQDLHVVMGGAYSGDRYQNLLFANPGGPNHWLTLQLEGVQTNRAAIGARIHIRVKTEGGDRDIHLVVSTGGSFGCSSLQQEVGLGLAESIGFVAITWPTTGKTQVFEAVAMDQAFLVREGVPELVPLQRRRFDLPTPGAPPKPPG